MTEKLTLKRLSGELETLRAQVLELEQQLERKLETTLEKAAARLKSRIESTRLPEHGSSIDTEHRQRLIAEEAYLIAEQRGFHVHGFRSTFRDWCAESTNYSADVAEMALAHTLRDKTEAAYRRGDLFEKRARLMADWARYCSKPAAPAQVIAIRQSVV